MTKKSNISAFVSKTKKSKISAFVHKSSSVPRSRTRLSFASGVEVQSLSFESLRQVTECLLDMNQDVARVMLECDNDVWKNRELFDLVEEYFDNSLQTMDFCSSLNRCLNGARVSQLLIFVALEVWEHKRNIGIKNIDVEMLKALKSFRDPFTKEVEQIFGYVLMHQTAMLAKLEKKKAKLDKKLRKTRSWRRVSRVIFTMTLMTLLACSVVAAAMAAPPVAAALSAACAIPLGSMGKWVDNLFKKCGNVIKGQKGVVNSMEVGIFVGIKDLEKIRTSFDELGVIMGEWDNLVVKEENVKFCVVEMKKNIKEFTKNLEELGDQVDVCNREIQKTRSVVIQRIIKQPSFNIDD